MRRREVVHVAKAHDTDSQDRAVDDFRWGDRIVVIHDDWTVSEVEVPEILGGNQSVGQ